jgi:putative ABC transport system permease protein
MAMRERVTEIAVLKAIGFSRGRVLILVLGEAFLISMLGGLFGVAVGCVFLQAMNQAIPQFFPLALNELAGLWMSYGLIAAAFLGIVSGIVPALQAARLSVINGLRRIA